MKCVTGDEAMKCILDYLEQTAARYPKQLAVDDGHRQWTWEELLAWSKRMGSAMAKRVQPQQAVVILEEKSAPTLAAMFGVVYAGCFYVMVDPAQPKARIDKILSVMEPALVIAESQMQALAQAAIDEELLGQVRRQIHRDDLLYGVFTSGSTGTPKGIVVSQGAVIDFISHFTELFGFSQTDRIGNQAPFDFDVSVKDIYSSVMTGAALILIPRVMFGTPPVLLDYLCEKQVTSLTWAVSALTIVSSLGGLRYRVPTTVHRVMFSGEVMPPKQLRLWQAALPKALFVNLYGPSEITCNCTYYPVTRAFLDEERLPIGRAFPGRRVFLLDASDQEITEAEQVGEICVAGESLAQGYYHNEQETKARFFYRAGASSTPVRCYRTGDLGYWDADGLLYFCGRKDFQIKHMGHRIELEEVEEAMNRIAGVDSSCCLLDERRGRLVAFYRASIDSREIRRQLKQTIPGYMVPQKLVPEERFPLNKNGKTDRAYFRRRLEVI